MAKCSDASTTKIGIGFLMFILVAVFVVQVAFNSNNRSKLQEISRDHYIGYADHAYAAMHTKKQQVDQQPIQQTQDKLPSLYNKYITELDQMTNEKFKSAIEKHKHSFDGESRHCEVWQCNIQYSYNDNHTYNYKNSKDKSKSSKFGDHDHAGQIYDSIYTWNQPRPEKLVTESSMKAWYDNHKDQTMSILQSCYDNESISISTLAQHDDGINTNNITSDTNDHDAWNRRWIFFGDSITKHWTGDKRFEFNTTKLTIKQLWYDKFSYFNTKTNTIYPPICYGIPGDRLQDLAWRLTNVNININTDSKNFINYNGLTALQACLTDNDIRRHEKTQLKYNIAMLIGTNDFGSQEYINVVLKEYLALLIELKNWYFVNGFKNQIKIYLLAIFPRNVHHDLFGSKEYKEWNWNEKDNDLFVPVNIVNYYLKYWASKEENSELFEFVDCDKYLLRQNDFTMWKDDNGTEYKWNTGFLNTTVFYDQLHLKYAGYDAWYQCLHDHIVS